MQSRLKETGKTLLIVLLCCSALMLAGKTELFKNFIDAIPVLSDFKVLFDPDSGKTVTGENKPVLSSAAMPVYAVVTSKYGDHCGIKYDNTALNTFYSRFGGIIAEALSFSDSPAEIEEKEWRAALSSIGVYLDFDNPMPLSALLKNRDSNNTSEQGNLRVRRICITTIPNSSRVYVFYIDEANGAFYRVPTKINYSLLSSYTVEYIPNDAKFAFELAQANDVYGKTDPYTVLLETTKPLAINASNPVGLLISKESIAELFGINPQFLEQNEPNNYVYEHFTLRVNSDGSVFYKVTGNNSGSILKVKSVAALPTDYEMLESARRLVTSTLGSVCGNGTTLQLTGFSYSAEEKLWNVYFDYYVNGIPVQLSSTKHAATVKISGGFITSASLLFRNYTLSAATGNVLPERQAAVLVSQGGEPSLYYLDDGGAALKPAWTER